MTCNASFRADANLFRFCRNTPISRYDALGLLTEQDCEDQYDKDMAAVKKEGTACIQSALKWGLWGELILGVGGTAIGAFGGPVGAGVGLFCGTGINGIIDMFHYAHCMKKVSAMTKAAEKAYQDCLMRVDQ
jgi:hypothetical protein